MIHSDAVLTLSWFKKKTNPNHGGFLLEFELRNTVAVQQNKESTWWHSLVWSGLDQDRSVWFLSACPGAVLCKTSLDLQDQPALGWCLQRVCWAQGSCAERRGGELQLHDMITGFGHLCEPVSLCLCLQAAAGLSEACVHWPVR